jgi:hypothetical protein
MARYSESTSVDRTDQEKWKREFKSDFWKKSDWIDLDENAGAKRIAKMQIPNDPVAPDAKFARMSENTAEQFAKLMEEI